MQVNSINPWKGYTIYPPLEDSYPYQRGTSTADGRWIPLMVPKAQRVFNDYTRVILLSGARKSAKTMCALTNRILRHAWEIDGGVVGIVGKTIRNVSEGLWKDLISFALPGWIDSGIGIKMTLPPRMTADSHMRYCRVSNMHGRECELQLHSLDHDHQVEQKFKSMRFSMLAISEVDQFGDRRVLDVLLDQLRVPGVPFKDHQCLMDANPPIQGQSHWLYNAMVNRSKGNKELVPNSAVYHFMIDDNWFLGPDEANELKRKYEYSKIKYDRFVNGLWVRDTESTYFNENFIPNIHVVGNCDGPNKADWEILAPPPGTPTLFTGSDLGDVNHACTFFSSRVDEAGQVCIDIIDELESIKRPISLSEFALKILEKIDYWNEWMVANGSKNPPRWVHFTDSSAMAFKANSSNTDAKVVFQATKGRIVMHPVAKMKGSVLGRINLIKRLLHENRLFVSASCRGTIDWLSFLRPGRTASEKIDIDLDCRHLFDSATYGISSVIPIEIDREFQTRTARKGQVVLI